MGFFVNPFRKHDVREFPDVLVPLRDAPRHPLVMQKYEEKGRTGTGSPEKDPERYPTRSSDEYSPFTIENLKAEIEEDVAASGHNTTYDRVYLNLPISLKSIQGYFPA